MEKTNTITASGLPLQPLARCPKCDWPVTQEHIDTDACSLPAETMTQDTREKCECKCRCQKPRCGDGGRGTPVLTWSACFSCGAAFLDGSRKHRAATR